MSNMSFCFSQWEQSPLRRISAQGTVIRFIQEMLPFNPCRPELRSNTGRARDIGKEESKCVSSHLFVCFYSRWSWLSCRPLRLPKLAYRFHSVRLPCPSTSSLFAPARVICGRLAIGPTITMKVITTGVPGTWVEAPEVGVLWTPGYWAWRRDGFFFNEGYWGPHIGFYGGIVYGFGYFGEGYEGGRWDNGRFFYNRSVNNVNVTEIHNVYNTTVINNTTTVNRVSYNGGNGGINARPRSADEMAARDRHIPPVSVQAQHVQAARTNPQLRASVNRGKPR